MFGWVGMPYIFQVLTRALVALCSFYIVGLCKMYVDDIMACSPLCTAEADMEAADTAVNGLLGPTAIAPGKNEIGRALDFIGWFIDLDNRSVTLSRRNLLKTIYAFFCFNIKDKITQSTVETMASLASRCSQLCRPMRPYTKALYDAIGSYPNRHVRHTLPSLAKVDVAVWRAFLLLSHFDPHHLCRFIASFAERTPTIIFEYDASLRTLAIGVSIRVSPTTPPTLLGFAAIDVPFPTTEARKQNSFEYMTVPVGVLLCQMLGLRCRSAEVWGDSMSSLDWSKRDRVNSTLARKANIGMTLAAAHIDVTITASVHIPGYLNTVYDGLTRNKSASEVRLPPHLQIHLPAAHPVHRFIALCDPDAPLEGYTQHAQLSHAFAAIICDPLMCLPPSFAPTSL
jgi:hypothetical protein